MRTTREVFTSWPVFEAYEITHDRIVPRGEIVRRYDATRETLYPELLKTEGTSKGILRFVERFGLSACDPDADARGGGTLNDHRQGDRLADWRALVAAARRFDGYVGLVKKGKDFTTAVPLPKDQAEMQQAMAQSNVEIFANRAMQRHYRLVLDADYFAGTFVLRPMPYGLIGLIWEQLIEMLVERRRFATCPTCSRMFEIQPRGDTGGRRNKVFCSDKCRATKGNEKKRLAKVLLAEGMPIREVARQVGTQVDTIRAWSSREDK